MPVSLTFPSTIELIEIEQDLLPTLIPDDPIFKLFPITNRDLAKVAWEQQDDYFGLMQAAGINGEPSSVVNIGGKRWEMNPGRYREYKQIDEQDYENRRAYGSLDQTIDIGDLVMEAQKHLLSRRIARIRHILWTLLTTGTFSVPGQNGSIIHTDRFTLQTQTAAVSWATVATATPIADFRACKLKARGYSVTFGRLAQAFGNAKTVNNLLGNTNAADIGGKRISGGNTSNSIGDFNRAIQIENDLPEIVEYDKGYKDDNKVWQPWIPDNTVVIVGSRDDGSPLGEFQVTRNAANDGAAPGPYTYVTNSASGGSPVPAVTRIDDGFNGGPAIYYPNGIIILSV